MLSSGEKHIVWLNESILTGSSRRRGPEILVPVWYQPNVSEESPVYHSHGPQPNYSSNRYSNMKCFQLPLHKCSNDVAFVFLFVWSCVNTALMTGVGGSWRLYRVYLNSCKQVLFKLQHMYFPEKVTHAFYVGEGDKGVNLVNNWQVEINCLCHVYGPVTVLWFKGKRN